MNSPTSRATNPNMELHLNQYRKRRWTEEEFLSNYSFHEDSTNYNCSDNTPTKSDTISATPTGPPIKRVANERERTRTASVNDAFLTLRSLIPTEPMNRKLSKIETLRLASSYISHLNAVLVTGSSAIEQPCLRHSQTLSTLNSNDKLINGKTTNTHRPVCTFCVTEMKQHQRQLTEQNLTENSTIITSAGQ